MMMLPFCSTQACASNCLAGLISIPISRVNAGELRSRYLVARARGRHNSSNGSRFAAVSTAQTVRSMVSGAISWILLGRLSLWYHFLNSEKGRKRSPALIHSKHHTARRNIHFSGPDKLRHFPISLPILPKIYLIISTSLSEIKSFNNPSISRLQVSASTSYSPITTSHNASIVPTRSRSASSSDGSRNAPRSM